LFCQIDVTARTESDPVADTLTRNILQHVSQWKPEPTRTAAYIGDPAGKRHLESTGFTVSDYNGGDLTRGQVLVVGPEVRDFAQSKDRVANWLKAGGHLLAVGFDQQHADALLPVRVTLKKAEHISVFFDPNTANSLLRGVGPADIHNRDPRELSLITSGATPVGNGVLATANEKVVFCQMVPWQFDPTKQSNLKRTYRRVSFVLTRLLSNLGVASSTPILSRFSTPLDTAKSEKRWLDGLYLDQPEEWDDPYRFFRW